MPGTLIYQNSRLATREELASIRTPEATATWHPISHRDLVEAIDKTLHSRGLTITAEKFALQRDGVRLFGVLDLSRAPDGEFHAALGLRHSNDKSMAVEIAVGVRVTVCDNLAFSGDLIALKRKHTSGFDLEAEITRAIDRYETHLASLEKGIGDLKTSPILDPDAKALIFDVFRARILPIRLFRTVSDDYFHPVAEMTDVQPRTRWGLLNAFTRAIREMPPAPAFTATTKLGKMFGLRVGS